MKIENREELLDLVQQAKKRGCMLYDSVVGDSVLVSGQDFWFICSKDTVVVNAGVVSWTSPYEEMYASVNKGVFQIGTYDGLADINIPIRKEIA